MIASEEAKTSQRQDFEKLLREARTNLEDRTAEYQKLEVRLTEATEKLAKEQEKSSLLTNENAKLADSVRKLENQAEEKLRDAVNLLPTFL